MSGQAYKIDRRRKHVEVDGVTHVVTYHTESCTGCFEGGDYMGMAHHYPYDDKAKCYVGGGCHECGYTGKRRNPYFTPAAIFYDPEFWVD